MASIKKFVRIKIKFIYKSCYDKDCRSSLKKRVDEGTKILDEVGNEFNIPVTADFSNAEWGRCVIWFKYLPIHKAVQ